MWRRRGTNANASHTSHKQGGTGRVSGPVGTEAVALENIRRNSRDFGYPKPGFVHPIEHSLLYAMISEPTLYPENLIKEKIAEEDFTTYLQVKSEPVTRQQRDEPQISYAQLSAILCLSAEKWPPPQQQQQDDDADDDGGDAQQQRQQQQSPPTGVSQILCKKLLQLVVRHASHHDLDREAEVQELLEPLQKLALKKDAKAELAVFLPIYIGMGATMVTANPLPMWIGASITNAMTFKVVERDGERRNISSMEQETNRMAHVEKASLLDEMEDDE
jgi:hypothetical protein